MAPSFSRPGRYLPPDVILEIAGYLFRRQDVLSVARSCKLFHYTVIPILYRSVSVTFYPTGWRRHLLGDSRHALGTLACLTLSMRPCNKLLSLRCNIQFIVTFSYSSHGSHDDFRALPLFGEVLRCAVRLRHLRIDVSPTNHLAIIDILRRSGIIITPTSTLLQSHSTSVSDARFLPQLQSVRASHLAIVEGLMRYRSLTHVGIDGGAETVGLTKFFRAPAPWSPSSLRYLYLAYEGRQDCEMLSMAIFASFPRLEHLMISTYLLMASPWIYGIFHTLESHAGASFGTQLQSISVNRGCRLSCNDSFQNSNITPALRAARPNLHTVILGIDVWHCKDGDASWKISTLEEEDVDAITAPWRWFTHPGTGEWGHTYLT